MHFVKKEPTTEEQRAAKEKERAVKLGKYLAARNKIFEKKGKDEYDEELLALTQAVLSKNPDITTFWNLRRKTVDILIDHLSSNDAPKNEIEKLLNVEMALTRECLMEANPKSYGAWHHRGWTLRRFLSMGIQPDFKSELGMCKKALDYDCRNFHCWDHRRIVSKLAGNTDEEELEFSLDRINHNFSNYSAWHYRSVLLPRVQYMKTGNPKLDDSFLKEELERIVSAFCCDAEDQSAFVYAQWLLSLDSCKTFSLANSSDRPVPLSVTFNDNKYTIVMTRAAKVDDLLDFIQLQDKKLFTPLSSLSVKAKSALVWTVATKTLLNIRLSKEDEWQTVDSLLDRDRLKVVFDCDRNRSESFFVKALLEQLEELIGVPPISAWTMYTYALCLMEVDPAKHHSKVMGILQDLADTKDPKRRELYRALMSRLQVCHALRKDSNGKMLLERILDKEEASLLLHRRGITSLKGIEYLAGFLKDLNVAENLLCNFDDLLLPNLEHLTISENPISRIPALPALDQLKSLNIASSDVRLIGDVLPGLQSLPSLEKLIFCETALVESAQQLREIIGNKDIRLINYWL